MTVPDDARSGRPEPDPVPAALLAIAEHGERLDLLGRGFDELGARLETLDKLLVGEPDRAGYTPIPAPRWWMLQTSSRGEAIEKLAAWVDQVYARSYGHLARMLGACWPEHDLCLFVLDVVSELHCVLYLRGARTARTLSDQAEFHLRILPAAAELMKAETTRCEHAHPRGVLA
jgi:hypothetical protein